VPASLIASQGSVSVSVQIPGGGTSNAVTFTINPPGSLTILTPSPLPNGALGVSYSQGLTATGGITPYKGWAIAARSLLPPGLSLTQGVLSGTGLLSGTPTSGGTFTFVIQVTDNSNAIATKQFTLTITGGPVTLLTNGIVNAASYAGGSVSPGEIVAIFGPFPGPATLVSLQLDGRGYVSTNLGGTQVLFDGVQAPMIYAVAGQVSCVVPYEVTGESSTQVQVSYQGQVSNFIAMPVAGVVPGLFTINASGSGQGAIVNQDGTVNSTSNPAAVGSIVQLYATGEGQTNPAGVDGRPDASPPPQPVTQPVTATVGGLSANVAYAGGVSGLVAGVLQVNVQIPLGLTSGGSVPIVLSMGGKTTQANVTLAVKGSAGSQVLAINSLSTTSPAPLTPLYLSTTGVNASAPVMAKFSNISGFSFTEQAIRVGSDGTVVVAAPLYIDPTSGTVAPGAVSLALLQGNQSTPPITLNIQGLPPLSTYGTNLGDITHAFLVFEALTVAQQINALQAIRNMPGNTVDVTHSLSTLNTLLTSVLNARRDIDQIMLNNSVVISAGKLPDGTPIQFDQSSLDITDRIIGAFLTELAPVLTQGVSSASRGSSTFQRVGAAPRFLRSTTSIADFPLSYGVQSQWQADGSYGGTSRPVPLLSAAAVKELLNILTKSANTSGIAQAIQAYSQSDASSVDKYLALVGGLGTALGSIPNAEVKEVGLAVGALAAMASMGSDIAVEVIDLGGMYSNPSLQPTYYAELRNTNTKLYLDTFQAFLNLAAAGSGLPMLGPFGEQIYNALEEGLPAVALQFANLVTNAFQMATAKEFSQSYATALDVAGLLIDYPFSSSDQGIAEVTGAVQVDSNNGLAAPQYEVTVSNGTTSFNTVADPDGYYQLYMPLQMPGFDYSNATLTFSTSMGPLGSHTIDLSHLTTKVPLQVSTTSNWCANPPTFAAYQACACLQFSPNSIQFWILCTP
jgi:uncharacterized protein (TIGR03437 family)